MTLSELAAGFEKLAAIAGSGQGIAVDEIPGGFRIMIDPDAMDLDGSIWQILQSEQG